jgi:hypothetical protein
LINQSLQRWHPEYWDVRQSKIAEQDTIPDMRRDIIFRDNDYKEIFKIKDGDSIKITVAYDGEELIRKCRFLDEHHMNVGSSCYHMDEFKGKMEKVGNTYEPIPGQTPMLDIVIAETGKPPRDIQMPLNHNNLRAIIGGELEIIKNDKFSVVIQGINGNGTLAVLGLNGDKLTSLHPYDAQKHKRELSERIPAVTDLKSPALSERLETGKTKPSALSERLETGKAKAAEHNAVRTAPDMA